MTITTDTRPETAQAQHRGMFDHKRLMMKHTNQKHLIWKWASEQKIHDEYGIPSEMLSSFHEVHGLPRLRIGDNKKPLYSLPALESILETLPELQDQPQ